MTPGLVPIGFKNFLVFSVVLFCQTISVEYVRHLNSQNWRTYRNLTKKKFKLKGSDVSDHLLLCNHSPSFDNFGVLTKENKKILLGMEESLLIMRDKPFLNRNIRSAPLHLFD